MTKDDFVREAVRRGYRNEPESLLGALYDVSTEFPADHPYQKLMENTRDGRSPEAEHADISCTDHPYLVTEEILHAIDAELAAMEATDAVKNAKQQISTYNEPWMQERARTELDELPQWRAYKKLNEDRLKEAGRIAADMKNGGDAAGAKDPSAFLEMTESIEKFAAAKPGAVYGSVLGLKLTDNMRAMGTAIERFIESEKPELKNPNVARSLIPLGMADPGKAAVYERMLKEKTVTRNRISLDDLQGESTKKPATAREHREKHAPSVQISRQI